MTPITTSSSAPTHTTDQWTKITEAYRTGRSSISSAQYAEQADAALKQAKADIDAYVNGDTIEVSFRLIGDFPSPTPASTSATSPGSKRETYTVKKGSTVYDVFTEALQDAGLTSTGAASGYVRSITAPSILGGYTLSEFDNGAGSGWMFTVNGTHGNYALMSTCCRTATASSGTTWTTTRRRPPPGSRPRISLLRNTPAATSATWSRPVSTARRRRTDAQ